MAETLKFRNEAILIAQRSSGIVPGRLVLLRVHRPTVSLYEEAE